MFPAIRIGALERYRVRGSKAPRLAEIDPRDRQAFAAAREEVERATAVDIAEIDRLQEILYAQAQRALLIVFQGVDTSGKDGAIRHVFGPIDPLGVTAVSFKKPGEQELRHDFLWRVHHAVPAAGMIGIFNRSHYEDVLVPRVHGLLSAERIEARYAQINAFERYLAGNGVLSLKFLLHISRHEQTARLRQRLEDPSKRWKFSPADLAERKHWDGYMAAYQAVLDRCSEAAPWFVVPADRKWYRNAVVARIIRATLEGMELAYPPDPPGLDGIEVD